MLRIGKGLPSKAAVEENAKQLARYGSICQENGLVPIIEPEILQDGSHSIDVCAQVSERVFSTVMRELFSQHLLIEGLLLKPNMVTRGKQNTDKTSSQEVAMYTIRTLQRSVLPAVPGIFVPQFSSPIFSQFSLVLVRRPKRGRGFSEPERHERLHHDGQALVPLVLLRPCFAILLPHGLVG